jgi:[ribosomal protein S5]-alanine N-acetyltransferase
MHVMIEGVKTRLKPACWGFSDEELRRRYRWSLDDELQHWSGSLVGGRFFKQFRDVVLKRDWPEDGKRISYGIFTSDGELIGMVSCYNIDRSQKLGELGVYLGEKSYWGYGYGTDAVIAFLRHLFCGLDFHQIYLHTYESNVRAQRSYLKIGFDEVARRRRYSLKLGYHDEIRMLITREQFELLHSLRAPAAAS